MDVRVSFAELDTDAIDVRVSHAELDTLAGCDVRVSHCEFDTAAGCDVRVSWCELDTTAACDVRVSWCEFDPQGATCDVRVSWCEFDPNAEQQSSGGISGGGGFLWSSYPYQTREDFYRAKAALSRTVPEEVLQAAEEVIRKAQLPRPEPAELDRAEADFRAFLANLLINWQQDYINALILEYQLAIFEQEEAQIVWLLFEM